MPDSPSRSERKRAAILEAAVREFQALGFDNASMDGIAASAEVSKRTVYNHFQSKDGLFEAIVDQLYREVDALEVAPYASDVPLAEQLSAIGATYVGMLGGSEVMSLSRITLSRFLLEPALAEKTLSRETELEKGLTGWIRAAAKDGRLSVDDVRVASTEFSSLLKAFAFWPQLFANHPKLTKKQATALVDRTVAMFLARYGNNA